MAIILDYARTKATKPRLTWPRRIFPGISVGLATGTCWLIGEWLPLLQSRDQLDNILGWVGPAIVPVFFCSIYASAHRPGLKLEALWSSLTFSLLGVYSTPLLAYALMIAACLVLGPM